MEKNKQKVSVIPYITLIVGYLIGAGILGIPVTSGLIGVLPALILMTGLMLMMFYSGSVIADEVIEARQETFNLPSLYEKHFGPIGKWIAIIANLIVLYGLIIAYLVGGATIFTKLVGIGSFWTNKIVLLIFFLLLTSLCIKGIELVKKCNVFLVFTLWVAFILLVIIGAFYVDLAHFSYMNLSIIPVAAPVILTSFFFHNIIPNISFNSGWDKKLVKKAMFIALVIGLLLNALWFLIGVGVMPLTEGVSSIDYAYIHNLPALTPMSEIIQTPAFVICAMTFGFIAIISSYFGNGLGLLGFVQDLLENTFKIYSRKLNVIICFGPPLLISLIDPHIFLNAMNIVGGVGIVLLFGIMPCLVSILKPKAKLGYKVLSLIILLIFLSIFCFEILHSTGTAQVKLPKVVPAKKEGGKYNKIVKYDEGERKLKDYDKDMAD